LCHAYLGDGNKWIRSTEEFSGIEFVRLWRPAAVPLNIGLDYSEALSQKMGGCFNKYQQIIQQFKD
jgi:hypothetical protein